MCPIPLQPPIKGGRVSLLRQHYTGPCCRYAEATQIVTKAVLDMSGIE